MDRLSLVFLIYSRHTIGHIGLAVAGIDLGDRESLTAILCLIRDTQLPISLVRQSCHQLAAM